VHAHAQDGAVIVNAGNGHTLCVTLRGEKLHGIFEHHTAALDRDSLCRFIRKLCNATITAEEIFDEGGHGAAVHTTIDAKFIAITGPNRARLLPEAYQAAPFGDMMLAGCFGLLSAWKRMRGQLP
jgi:uncharacterized protein (DUF1786 family)